MFSTLGRAFAPCLLLSLLAISARAQASLTGTVVDPVGTGLAGVTISLDTGASQVTAANGTFAFPSLVARTYVVSVLPTGSQFAPRQLSIPVAGTTNAGNIAVQAGAAITATVVDPQGLALPGANLDAIDVNRLTLFTPNDGAGVTGNISVVVPLGLTEIRIAPPLGRDLIEFRTLINVTGPVALGTVTLQTAHVVSGSVVDAITSLPIAGAEIVTYDNLTDLEIPQTNPLTNALGAFTLRLPRAVVRFEVDPPTGNPHAAKVMHGVFVLGSQNIGLVRMQPSITLSGTVTGPGGPVQGCDIDIETTDGHKLFTLHDNTDLAGAFQVNVPAGTYRIRVDPPPDRGLVGTRTVAQTFVASTAVAPIALQAGVALQATIIGPQGPEPEADLDFTDPLTGEPIIIVGDKADLNGVINAVVPVGVFDIDLDARQGSVAAPLSVQVPIAGPISVPVFLPNKAIAVDLQSIYGITTIGQGGTLWVDARIRNLSGSLVTAVLELVVQYPSGAEQLLVALPPASLPPGLDVSLFAVPVPTPVVPASELGRELRFYLRMRDQASVSILDNAYTEFVVQ